MTKLEWKPSLADKQRSLARISYIEIQIDQLEKKIKKDMKCEIEKAVKAIKW